MADKNDAYYMEKVNNKKSVFHYIGLVCGFLAIAACVATIVLALTDNHFSLYTLATAIMLLGFNRICLRPSSPKKRIIENICITTFIFVLSVLVSLTRFSIYFLISSMFGYSLTIIAYCIVKIVHEKSIQMIIFHALCITLSFLFSFVFFFPAIYAKHATSVSNSNFIVFCYTAMILVSTSKNILFPYHKKLKINIIFDVIRKSLVDQILLGLLILIVLCSVYFTIVEPNITSYVDALWYSFAVITTIGFGDVYVVTTFGRILSVILGISGIAVVAVFTSVIVNFYNEMNKRREEKTLKKIVEEAEEEVIEQEKK